MCDDIINTNKCGKQVNDIVLQYKQLENEAKEFIEKFKFKKDNSISISVRLESLNNVINLYIHGFKDADKHYVKNAFYFINRDIIQYKEWVLELTQNYKEIKQRISAEQLRNDNKYLKTAILDTLKQLHDLKDNYKPSSSISNKVSNNLLLPV